MRRFAFFPLALAATAAALADSPLFPVQDYKRISYDMATGAMSPTDPHAGGTRGDVLFWDASRFAGSFTSGGADEVLLDWGDTVDGVEMTCFTFAYATDASQPITLDWVFYSDENGFNTPSRIPFAAYRIVGLPGGRSGPGIYSGWVVTITPSAPVPFTGADLDFDSLMDFGYSYHFRTALTGGEIAGPTIYQPDPNIIPFPAPGIENAFDLFVVDANSPPGPNDLLLAGINTLYDGAYWFGGNPFAQFNLLLFRDSNLVECNTAGCEVADIEPVGGDCDVDITDLATLLSNFGTASGALRRDGDIDPLAGDGDVDITDLAEMLADFGAVCN